jgi:hypothetical protein
MTPIDSPKAPPEGWAGLLREGEDILWQGQPEPGFGLKPAHIFSTLFGLAFSGFALVWMLEASQSGGYFWMFGLIHFTAGIGVMIGPIVGPAYMRRKTWYTLTNQRAFIADISAFGQKRLNFYPIKNDTPIEIISGNFTTINFASRTRRGKNRTYTVPVGFERLRDGATVNQLINDMQKDTT